MRCRARSRSTIAKLLAYKDEYEVARLFTDGSFEKQIAERFEGDFWMSLISARRSAAATTPRASRGERAFGPRMLKVFRVLAKFKLAARHAARYVRLQPRPPARARSDRRLREGCRHRARPAVAGDVDTAVEFLSLPDRIRGYGPVKEKAVQDAKTRYAQLAADLVNPPPAPRQIAAE